MYPSRESTTLQTPAPSTPVTSMPMPPTVPPPQLVINITQNMDPASKFIKGVKRLPDDFPTLKEDRKWREWKKSVNIMAKAQLISKALDSTYVPTLLDMILFEHKKTYMLAVFKKN